MVTPRDVTILSTTGELDPARLRGAVVHLIYAGKNEGYLYKCKEKTYSSNNLTWELAGRDR